MKLHRKTKATKQKTRSEISCDVQLWLEVDTIWFIFNIFFFIWLLCIFFVLKLEEQELKAFAHFIYFKLFFSVIREFPLIAFDFESLTDNAMIFYVEWHQWTFVQTKRVAVRPKTTTKTTESLGKFKWQNSGTFRIYMPRIWMQNMNYWEINIPVKGSTDYSSLSDRGLNRAILLKSKIFELFAKCME